jgi:hypothetical protein
VSGSKERAISSERRQVSPTTRAGLSRPRTTIFRWYPPLLVIYVCALVGSGLSFVADGWAAIIGHPGFQGLSPRWVNALIALGSLIIVAALVQGTRLYLRRPIRERDDPEWIRTRRAYRLAEADRNPVPRSDRPADRGGRPFRE